MISAVWGDQELGCEGSAFREKISMPAISKVRWYMPGVKRFSGSER